MIKLPIEKLLLLLLYSDINSFFCEDGMGNHSTKLNLWNNERWIPIRGEKKWKVEKAKEIREKLR